jgi:hypothetical protein
MWARREREEDDEWLSLILSLILVVLMMGWFGIVRVVELVTWERVTARVAALPTECLLLRDGWFGRPRYQFQQHALCSDAKSDPSVQMGLRSIYYDLELSFVDKDDRRRSTTLLFDADLDTIKVGDPVPLLYDPAAPDDTAPGFLRLEDAWTIGMIPVAILLVLHAALPPFFGVTLREVALPPLLRLCLVILGERKPLQPEPSTAESPPLAGPGRRVFGRRSAATERAASDPP